MMRVTPAVALLVLLAGCAATPAPVATVTATTTTTATAIADPAEPSPTATPTPTTDPEGRVLKKVGDLASVVGEDGVTYVKFRVNRIEKNFKCKGEWAEKSKNGHYVGIWMEFWTDKAVGGDDVYAVFTDEWQVVGSDGVTENDSSGNGSECGTESQSLPQLIEGAKHVKGVVVVDTKYDSGSLVFTWGDLAGWKYDF